MARDGRPGSSEGTLALDDFVTALLDEARELIGGGLDLGVGDILGREETMLVKRARAG